MARMIGLPLFAKGIATLAASSAILALVGCGLPKGGAYSEWNNASRSVVNVNGERVEVAVKKESSNIFSAMAAMETPPFASNAIVLHKVNVQAVRKIANATCDNKGYDLDTEVSGALSSFVIRCR